MHGRDRREVAAIFAGGAVGALARVGLLHTGASTASSWPWITFSVNIVGVFTTFSMM
jgi:CrcB protein